MATRIGIGDVLNQYLAPYAEQALMEEYAARRPIGRQTPVTGTARIPRVIGNPAGVDPNLLDWIRNGPRGPANLPPGWVDPDSRFPNTPLPPPGSVPSDPNLPAGGGGPMQPRVPIGNQPIDVGDINDHIARLIRDQVIPRSIRDTEGDQGFNKGFQRKAPTTGELSFSTLDDLLKGGGTGLEGLVSDYLDSFNAPEGQSPAYDKGFQQTSGVPGTPAGGAPPPAGQPPPFTPADPKGQPAQTDPNQATGGQAGMPTASYYDPIFQSLGLPSPSDLGVQPGSIPYQDPRNSMWGVTGGGGGYQMGELGPASTEPGMANPFATGAGGTNLTGGGGGNSFEDFVRSYMQAQQQQTPTAAPTTPTTPTTPETPTTPPVDPFLDFLKQYFNWDAAPTTPETPAPETEPTATAGGSPATAAPTGQDYSKYYHGGNIGNSAFTGQYTDPAWHPPGQPGSDASTRSYDAWRAEMAKEYPWMEDTSITWGGGPSGYLPIGYQAQPYEYYQQAQEGTWSKDPRTGRMFQTTGAGLAPWEYKYMQENWTQNYDPNQPGYVNTRDPNNPNAQTYVKPGAPNSQSAYVLPGR